MSEIVAICSADGSEEAAPDAATDFIGESMSEASDNLAPNRKDRN